MPAPRHVADPPPRLLAVAVDSHRGAAIAGALFATEGNRGSQETVVTTVADALASLRATPCDAVVVLHEPPAVDGLTLVRAMRGAGDETPVAIIGHERAIDQEEAAWQAGADEYACLAETAAPQLAGRLRRAVATRQRLRELRRLLQSEGRRLSDVRDETTRAIDAQRRLLQTLRDAAPPATREPVATLRIADRPDSALEGYVDWLRAALVGQPDDALPNAIAALAAERVAAPALLEAHLAVVAELTTDLTPRAEAVIRRDADARLLQATVHLAEAYRRRYAAAANAAKDAPPVPKLRVAG